MKKTIVISILLSFLAINGYALAFSGWSGFVDFADSANGWTLLALADLTISLGLACAWMIGDARSRGKTAMPYVLLTLTTGSIGPLVYLLRRD